MSDKGIKVVEEPGYDSMAYLDGIREADAREFLDSILYEVETRVLRQTPEAAPVEVRQRTRYLLDQIVQKLCDEVIPME